MEQVRLSLAMHLCGVRFNDEERLGVSVGAEKDIQLPFLPRKGDSICLDLDSEAERESEYCLKIKKVVFEEKPQRVTVYVKWPNLRTAKNKKQVIDMLRRYGWTNIDVF